MPFWTYLYVWFFWLLLALVSLACWRWGDRPVRLTAAALVGAMALSIASLAPHGWQILDHWAIAVDVIFLVTLIAILRRWLSAWLLVMAAIQSIEIVGHLGKAIWPGISPLTYAILIGGGAYFQVACLSFGLMRSFRTRRSTVDRPASGSLADTRRRIG